MASAIDKCKAVAGALGKKHPEYEFKSSTTMGTIPFLMIEVWKREPRDYIGSDIRSRLTYSNLTGEDAQGVVNSVKDIIRKAGSKRH
jgi:hypothetical protein